MNSSSTLADALAGGGKYIRWDDAGMGTIVEGTIESVIMRQARKFESTEPDYWDDGTPKMQAVIEVSGTNLRDPHDQDDDGRRSIVVNLWSGQKRALADACRQAGVREPSPGDTFAAVWTSGAGGARDPRQFAYRITKGTGLAATLTPPAAAADPFAAAPAAAPAAPAAAPAGIDLTKLTPEQAAAIAALGATT